MHRPARFLAHLLVASLALTAAPSRADEPEPGLDAAAARALLERFGPLVLLAPAEQARPANVNWFLARSRLDPDPWSSPRVTQASLLGDWEAILHARRRTMALLRPARVARRGSSDPRQWVTYGHVYPAQGGGWMLQYWFFYPFNDGHFLFDHEGDWEHVTVQLDAAQRPLGAYYARHADSAPGPWFPWGELAREGEHPVVLSARGTHASYASPDDARWYESVCATREPAVADAAGCFPWRTWDHHQAGGVLLVGSRDHPQAGARFISWPGEWGLGSPVGLTDAPRGPAYQASWCVMGTAQCR